MKNIPIVILNRDRLIPLKKLVDSLHKRGYYNLIVIDNLSTYQPLLDYYAESKLNVYVNNGVVINDNSTLYRLAVESNDQYFKDIVSQWYVYTDSDVVLTENVPDNFIEDMINVCKKRKCCFENCQTRSNFNYEGQTKGLYCSNHKLEGMIDIKSKVCIVIY